MDEHAYAVIMAGGRGERFWPLSTAKRPKQLLSLIGERELLGQAVDRLEGLVPPERIFIVTNADLVDATRKVAHQLPAENIVGEPCGRNTAPAVALGAALVKARDPDGVFAILTADHIMDDLDVYRQTLREAFELASREDVFITIGITTKGPNTGFGYIERGALKEQGEVAFYHSKRFVEKPSLELAEQYHLDENFYWNAGMFIWSVKALQAGLVAHQPSLATLIDLIAPTVGTEQFCEVLGREYQKMEKLPIDVALMEKVNNVVVADGTFIWHDVGSWDALPDHVAQDADDNSCLGDVQLIDCEGNIVFSKGGHLTAMIGVQDLIVVQSEGVTLVCPRDRAQDIKKMVTQVKESGVHEDLL